MSEKAVVIDLDAIEKAAKAAMQEPVSTAFLVKTNDELNAWMGSFYADDAETDAYRLHSLWAWQEQERRRAPVVLELIRRLRAAEALAASRIEQIPVDTRVLAIFADIKPEHRAYAEEFTRLIQRRTSSWTLVAYFNTDAHIAVLDVETMRARGWIRAPRTDE